MRKFRKKENVVILHIERIACDKCNSVIKVGTSDTICERNERKEVTKVIFFCPKCYELEAPKYFISNAFDLIEEGD